MRSKFFAVTATAILAASGATAATYTFDFDDRDNLGTQGSGPNRVAIYEEVGYVFSPFNFNNANSCYDGSCYLETTNGTPTILTEGNGDSFDLLSLYFNFQGTAPNALRFSDSDPDELTIDLGNAYDGLSGFQIFLADTLQLFTGILEKQVGYFIVFDDIFTTDAGGQGSFDGIDLFSTEAIEDRQVRIDCVTISTDGSNMLPANLGACSPNVPPPPTPVPLPAAGWLLAAGLGGLGALRRRRKS